MTGRIRWTAVYNEQGTNAYGVDRLNGALYRYGYAYPGDVLDVLSTRGEWIVLCQASPGSLDWDDLRHIAECHAANLRPASPLDRYSRWYEGKGWDLG